MSVIIPTYNRADLLPRAIRSVLAQTYALLEVIVVDDASTDDTPGTIVGITDPRLTYVRHSANRGVSAAQNTGIQAAKGELIAFLGDDDTWLPDKLAKQVPLFERPEVGLVYCGVEAVDREDRRQWISRPLKRGRIYEDLLFKNYLYAPAVVVRRRCLEGGNLFDEKLRAHEDQDLWLRIADTWLVDYVPEVLVRIAVFPREHLAAPERVIPAFEPFIANLRTYHYRSPWLRRQVLAYRYYTFASTLATGGQLAAARRRYLQSLGFWPFSPKCWLSLVATLTGPSLYRRADRYRAPIARLLYGLKSSDR